MEASYTPRFHDNKRYDSQGGEVAAGVTFDRAPFVNGEIAALWQYRNYADPALANINGLGVRAQLNWMPTEFTRLSLGSDFKINESIAGASTAVRQWSADFGYEQLIHDDVTLFAGADVLIEDGANGDDITLGSDAGVRWYLNRSFGLSLAYENQFSFGGAKSNDYSDHRVIASILLRP